MALRPVGPGPDSSNYKGGLTADVMFDCADSEAQKPLIGGEGQTLVERTRIGFTYSSG